GGPVEGDERGLGRDIYAVAQPPRAVLEPGPILVEVGGVDDDQIVVGGDPVDDQIVHDAAGRQTGHGVERAPVGEAGDVVGDEALHRLGCPRAPKPDLAHVADVE